ncbi:MAG: threonine/serine dehydratase [Deltaproteobacteria bacterium]|nr:threonine/serine dehydratase [Deltaproteobacteria bacterium]HDM10090.1 threonine/serine dehydratase [Desulfobacteraceae bacterium]
MIDFALTLRDLYLAQARIAPLVRKTPLVSSPALAKLSGSEITLKLENLQETGSFKPRGAANKILSLNPEVRERGIITVSSGNHGRAVAYVAHRLGLRALVFLADNVPANKLNAIQKLGAEVIVQGKTYEEASEEAYRLMAKEGLEMIHPYNDPAVIAGQGTIGLELLDEFPALDTVIVPLSGGGLLGGIAFALKSADPGIHVVGVSMERSPAMVESLRAGRVVEIVEEPTLADALAGNIHPCDYTFPLVQKTIDATVLVSEEEIASAMNFALEEHHLVVEGGGAVALAALISGKVKHLGKHVAVVVSGGNVDMSVLLKVAREHPSGR